MDNPYSIDFDELLKNEGVDNTEELVMVYYNAGSVPAMCSESCEVEPDGTCPHGCNSFLIALGLI